MPSAIERIADAADWLAEVRTRALDEMLVRAVVRDGIDLVLNLAGGPDDRPYRLALPSRLRWVQVHLPGMIGYREHRPPGAPARCAVERVGLDLADVWGRRALFARLSREARRVLVTTEGLLADLAPADVAALAADLRAAPSFGVWLTDLGSPRMPRVAQRRHGKPLARAGAAARFAPAEGAGFFEPRGWACTAERSLLEEARRLGRERPMARIARLTLVTPRRRRAWRRAALLLELTRT